MLPAVTSVNPIRRLFRKWEVFGIFPVFVVIGFALGGDAALWVAALVFPVVIAMHSWAKSDEVGQIVNLQGKRLGDRPAFIAAANNVLAQCLGNQRTTAVLMVQVDPLLMVEGKWAAALPDDVLERMEERIGLTVRDRDTVARCGEGVFGILLNPIPRADLEITMGIVDRLQAAVSEPLIIDGQTLRLTCAIGLCLQDRSPAQNGAGLVTAAECALRTARRAGEDGVRAFTQEMQRQVEVEHQLTERVTPALDSGEIRPWFQPQISTDTGTITGFEALARWHHPDLGVLTPAHFLPAVGASHAYVQLGEVILLHSIKALKSWDKAGIRVPKVGLNFSLEELRDPRLAERIVWQLDRYDLHPDRICIEILETVTLQEDDDAVIRNLKALQAAGFGLDLDDFGTGHASIAHIARFGVSRVKIDRSFVTGVDKDAKQKRLVAAILSMAEHLRIETVAEGVETPGEHSALAQLGCTHVQGYGIAKPMPFEDTIGWATAHNAKLANTAHFKGRRLG